MKYRITQPPRWLPSIWKNGRRVQYRFYTVVEFHDGGWWTLEDFITSLNKGQDIYQRLHDCIQSHCDTIQRCGLVGDRTDRFQAEQAGRIITSLAPYERLQFTKVAA